MARCTTNADCNVDSVKRYCTQLFSGSNQWMCKPCPSTPNCPLGDGFCQQACMQDLTTSTTPPPLTRDLSPFTTQPFEPVHSFITESETTATLDIILPVCACALLILIIATAVIIYFGNKTRRTNFINRVREYRRQWRSNNNRSPGEIEAQRDTHCPGDRAQRAVPLLSGVRYMCSQTSSGQVQLGMDQCNNGGPLIPLIERVDFRDGENGNGSSSCEMLQTD